MPSKKTKPKAHKKPMKKAPKKVQKAPKKALKNAPKKKPVAKKQIKAIKQKPKEAKKIIPPIPSISPSVEESIMRLKEEVGGMRVPEIPKAPPVIPEKVHMQNITFEITNIRQVMGRISKQLEKIEKELGERKEE